MYAIDTCLHSRPLARPVGGRIDCERRVRRRQRQSLPNFINYLIFLKLQILPAELPVLPLFGRPRRHRLARRTFLMRSYFRMLFPVPQAALSHTWSRRRGNIRSGSPLALCFQLTHDDPGLDPHFTCARFLSPSHLSCTSAA